MLISRLTLQIARVARGTEHFVSRSVASLPLPRLAVSAHYSTHPSSKNGVHSQQWYALEPELEEMLVPRKMSISPLESWLTVRYIFPNNVGFINVHERLNYEPAQQYNLPPCSQGTEEDEEVAEIGESTLKQDIMECKKILKIRRRKMNRHKYKKLMKRTKFLRKKIKEGRRRRKQKRFERDLERVWRRAGLRKPPEGWVVPKIYLKNVKSD